MTVSDSRKKLIDRITKLLALAEDSAATQGEKDNAARMAAELMAKHNIALQDAQAKPEYQIDDDAEVSTTDKFDWTLAHAVATFNGCQTIFHRPAGSRDKVFRVVGTTADIEAYAYMKDVVYRQRTDAYLNHVRNNPHYQRGTKAQREYYMGFAYGVWNLIDNLMRKRDAVIHERGLVVLDEQAQAKAWYEQQFGNLRSSKSNAGKFDINGFNAGKEARLNKGVTQTGTPKAISL